MKTLNFLRTAAIGLLSMAFSGANAQVAKNSLELSPLRGIHHTALKNFTKSYGQAIGAEWSVIGKNSLMCRFVNNGIASRAFYNPNGQWAYTLSGYDAAKLDPSVHERVKCVFYNYAITYVDEIDMPNRKPVYIVEIQNEKSIKKIRVAGDEDEIEVLTDLQK